MEENEGKNRLLLHLAFAPWIPSSWLVLTLNNKR